MLAWFQFLLGFAGIFGLYRAGIMKHRVLRYILVLQVVSIVLSFVNPGYSIMLFYLCALLMLLYCLFAQGSPMRKKAVITLIVLPVVIQGLFAINDWPNMVAVKALQVVPLLVFLLSVLPRRKEYENELGSLVIISTDALIQVVLAIMYMMS